MPANKQRKGDTMLCRNFCQYYKPGRNEELACRGYLVVHGLLRKGRKLLLERPEEPHALDPETMASLRECLCGACAFRAGDCDFILTGTAEPCGGFILLSSLLGTGELTLAEIESSCGNDAPADAPEHT